MTIDKRRAPARAGQLPAFSPVPRLCQRHDGWTQERQHGFIEALADTGSVKAAAHRVNMTPEGAYMLRRHPDAGSFRKAWEAALALGIQQLEDAAMDRALHGVDVPVYSYGKLVGTRTIYNERLVMFMLRNRAPTRFAGDGRAGARRSAMGDPAEANRLSRLKRQWRQEWEAERAAEDEREDAEVTAQLQAQLESIHANRQAALTRRTRALYETARLAEAEDLAAQRFGFDEDDEEEEGEDGYGDGDADRAGTDPDAGAPQP